MTRIVREAIAELRLHFFALKDPAIDMACKGNFQAGAGEPAYTPPCAAANQIAGAPTAVSQPACNMGFGMNFEFALPPAAINNVMVNTETVTWDPGNLKVGTVQLALLDLPFGVETAVAEETPTPFTAYLRLTPPSGLPSASFSVSPPENSYFTVFPGAGQFGTLLVNSLAADFAGAFVITVRKADTTDIPPSDRDTQADLVVMEHRIAIAPRLMCDANSDNVVDIRDVREDFVYRGLPTTPPDPFDPDADGVITVNDGRICTLRCTNPGCALQ
jgi:hypothetical protein